MIKNSIYKIFSILIIGFILVACGEEYESNTGKIAIPYTSKEAKHKDYKKVIGDYEEAGFTNVTTERIEDLIFGFITSDGEVEKVLIDGKDDYSEGDLVNNKIDVVVYYHTFEGEGDTEDSQETEKTTEKGNESSSETIEERVDKNKEELEKSLSDALSYIEENNCSGIELKNHLTEEEYSSPAIEYAMTNCNADWNEVAKKRAEKLMDESDYLEKELRHKLVDASFNDSEVEYAISNCDVNWDNVAKNKAKEYLSKNSLSEKKLRKKLNKDGFTKEQIDYAVDKNFKAIAKNEKKIIQKKFKKFKDKKLSTVYDKIEALGYKVTYIAENTGDDFTETLKISPEDRDIFYVQSVSNIKVKDKKFKVYILGEGTINDRKMRSTLEAKLDPYDAWVAVEDYGQYMYGNSFTVHYFLGKLAEEARDENTWFLKATCTVEIYGVEFDRTVEATVTGTNDYPQVTYFLVY